VLKGRLVDVRRGDYRRWGRDQRERSPGGEENPGEEAFPIIWADHSISSVFAVRHSLTIVHIDGH